MSFWYASLYVVVEGWLELGLKEPNADRLLESPFVDLLRRYRNGVFHYQREMWDERFENFLREGGAAARWVRHLHLALGNWLQARVEEMADAAEESGKSST
jgi:hypothetical protein